MEGGVRFTDGPGDAIRRPIRLPSTTISSEPQPNRPSPVRPGKFAPHEGIDLTTGSGNAVIQSIAKGEVKRVVNATNDDGNSCGYRVYLDHGSVELSGRDDINYNLRASLYCHLDQTSVSVGDSVEAGTAIGISGTTGANTGDHLHLQLFTDGTSTTDVGPYGVYLSIVTGGDLDQSSSADEEADELT